jgi:hypothetical protein
MTMRDYQAFHKILQIICIWKEYKWFFKEKMSFDGFLFDIFMLYVHIDVR